jgi:hypothetical protein
MKRILSVITAAAMLASLTLTASATAVSRKVQIDWLIYGAGGNDFEGRRGDAPHETVTGEFMYGFVSEDDDVRGYVIGRGWRVDVYVLDEYEEFVLADDGSDVVEFAQQFTEHFATLSRIDHFHDTHPLSETATEEYPIEPGSHTFMTFTYSDTDDGPQMNAMILDGVVKHVHELQNSIPEELHLEMPDGYTMPEPPSERGSEDSEAIEDSQNSEESQESEDSQDSEESLAPETRAADTGDGSDESGGQLSAILPIAIAGGALVAIVAAIMMLTRKNRGIK